MKQLIKPTNQAILNLKKGFHNWRLGMCRVFKVDSTDKYSRKRGILPTKYRIQMINYFVYSSFLGRFRQENNMCVCIYRVSQEESARLRECVPYVKLYRYNPKHLYPKLNGYGDNGQRKVWSSCGFHVLYLASCA